MKCPFVIIIDEWDCIFRLFKDDKNWVKYKSCVLATNIDNNESGLNRLIPKLKRGNIEVSTETNVLKGKLGLDFEWGDKEHKTVRFSSIVKQVNTLFKKLVVSDNPERLYLFFDELELSFNTTKQYNNDIIPNIFCQNFFQKL